jgi:histidinol-phosphate aminotransferase
MTGDLIQHVIQERNAGSKLALTGTIEIETHANLRLQCIARDFGLPHGSFQKEPAKGVESEGHDTISLYLLAFSENLMSRFWSKVVSDLTPYVPGEQPKLANLIKLNTNENPYPPSPRVQLAIQAELGDDAARLRLYPDPNADLLKSAIAKTHGIRAQQVFLGNGSDEVLAHVFLALLKHDRPILFPDITYSFYPVYCGLYGIDYQTVPLAGDFTINPADFCARANGGIIFPNPNAPTGRLLALDAIEQIVQANPDSVVVVDEAYVDFGGVSAIQLVDRYDNLLVIHTLSKSRSLAGLRVGFAVGQPALIEALERVKNSFNSYPLDRLAIVGAVAAMEDSAHFERTRQAVISSRETLSAELDKLGFEVLPSAANFIFARHPQRDALELAQALRDKNIIVRHFKLPRIDQFLRITIGTEAECKALTTELAQILA